jgi:undecaprenyl-diphosphatase
MAPGVMLRTGGAANLSRSTVTRKKLLRLPSFITNRFSTKNALGLSLTIGLIVAAGATWLFAALLDAVFDKDTMVRWDLATATRIHQAATPAGTRIFDWITRVGSPNSMTWMTIVICLLLFATRRVQLGMVWGAAFGGGAALETMLKSLVHRTRPEYAGHYLAAGSYSFPSGHATLSFLAVSMLIYTLIRTNVLTAIWSRVAVITAGVIWILLVGMSRIYLGVHFPSDVLGGYTIAAAWFTTCITLANIAVKRRSARAAHAAVR